MSEDNRKIDFKKKIKISNEQLKKLLPDESQWTIPIVGDNFVRIPLENFEKANILLDDFVCEIYKDKNGNIFLEL